MKLRFSMTSFLCAAGILAGAATLLPQSQNARAQSAAAPATPEAVIHAETRVVLVDAVVSDKKNSFVRDLQQKDFRIWEDGKEQTITSFSLESAGLSPDRSNKHYIVLFFDTSTLSPAKLANMRTDAAKFVDRFATPDRYMAVISYGTALQVLQNFTSNAASIKAALAKVQSASGAAAAAGSGRVAAAGQVSAYVDMLASLRSTAASLGAIRGRKAMVLFSSGFSVTQDVVEDLNITVSALNKANVAVYGVTGEGLSELIRPGARSPGGVLASLEKGASQAVQGVASLVIQASGAESTGSKSDNPAALDFQRGGGGGGAGGAGASTDISGATVTPVTNSDVPTLTEGTGGFLLQTSANLPDVLGRIAQEQDSYYLIGYTPTVESAEGSCHSLQVKVDRSGLEVRARKDYCTTKSPDPLGGKAEGKDLEARAASNAPGNMTAKMQLPWFYAGQNEARVDVAMDINPSEVKFQKEKNKFHGEIDLSGVAYKADGTPAARMSDVVNLDFDTQQQVDAFLKSPYHYENQFDIAPGQYSFRVAVGSGAQGFGKVEEPLDIGPWNGQSLSASGIALSHDAHPSADLTAGIDASLLEGVTPLVAQGLEIVPAGATQFHAGDKAYLYFEVYEPLLATAKPGTQIPGIGIQLRVLDRSSGKQVSDSGVKFIGNLVRPGNAVIPVASQLAIAGLPPGAYKLQVSVMHQTGDPVVRTADFDVIP